MGLRRAQREGGTPQEKSLDGFAAAVCFGSDNTKLLVFNLLLNASLLL
jgi:hypothetical protein